MALTVSDICLLFARKGGRLYEGEPVTQLEHALQSAARAEAASAAPALVCAAPSCDSASNVRVCASASCARFEHAYR